MQDMFVAQTPVKRWWTRGLDEVNVVHHFNRLSVVEYETAPFLAHIIQEPLIVISVHTTGRTMRSQALAYSGLREEYWREIWILINNSCTTTWFWFPRRFHRRRPPSFVKKVNSKVKVPKFLLGRSQQPLPFLRAPLERKRLSLSLLRTTNGIVPQMLTHRKQLKEPTQNISNAKRFSRKRFLCCTVATVGGKMEKICIEMGPSSAVPYIFWYYWFSLFCSRFPIKSVFFHVFASRDNVYIVSPLRDCILFLAISPV